jgi:hypothetical protein
MPEYPRVIDYPLDHRCYNSEESIKALQITQNICLLREGHKAALFLPCQGVVRGRKHVITLINSGLTVCRARDCGLGAIIGFAQSLESMLDLSFSAETAKLIPPSAMAELLEAVRANKYMSVY